MRFKKFTWLLRKHWRSYLVIVGIFLVSILILRSDLNSLNVGLTAYEQETVSRVSSDVIKLNEPLNTPFYIFAKILNYVFSNPLEASRTASIILAFLSVVAFYILLYSMFDERISAIGAMLYLSSSWFLHSSRVALTFSSSICSIIILLAIGAHINTIVNYKRLIIPLVPIIALTLYSPVTPIVLLVILLFNPVKTYKIQKELSIKWKIILIVLTAIILAPLVFMLIASPSNILRWIGLPNNFAAFSTILQNILLVPFSIFYRSQADPALHLARLPMLDIYSSVLFALGIYALLSNIREKFNQILLVLFVALGLVTAMNQNINLSLHWLLPFVYIIIVFGFIELLGQWISVFPRNPVARGIGIGLIVVSIGFISTYHLNRYFMAWPSTPETKKAYIVSQ